MKLLLPFIFILLGFTTLAQDKIKLLFVGNSLTYYNDLPSLVKEVGIAHSIRVETTTIAYPNYALEDHWNDGEVQRILKKRKFDFLIIQQGPSSQQYGKESLLAYGKKLKAICDQNETQLAFFMVWPSLQYYQTFGGVIENYTSAASASSAILFPVGKVWKRHFDETGDFSYYGPDGFHPSLKGSQIAAEVIFNSLLR